MKKLTPKRCKNCNEPFKPAREWQEFCDKYGKGACKKQFWRAGGVSIGRLRPVIEEIVTERVKAAMAEIVKRLETMEGKGHR